MRGKVPAPGTLFGEGVGPGGEAFPGRLGISAPWRLVFRDVAQSGSAPEWGSGGRGFKSRRPDWLMFLHHVGGSNAWSSEVAMRSVVSSDRTVRRVPATRTRPRMPLPRTLSPKYSARSGAT